MLAVYVTSRRIQAVVFQGTKLTVTRTCSASIPEDILRGGTIQNPTAMKEKLEAFWLDNKLPKKEVLLILGDGQSTSRYLTAPKLSKNAMFDFLVPEFIDVSRGQKSVYAYDIVEENRKLKKCEVFATMASRALIESYLKVFGELEISISEITSDLTLLLKILNVLLKNESKTVLLQNYENEVLTNILIVSGKYAYSNVVHMNYKPGTPAFSVELARQVNRIRQFMKAQSIDEEITDDYLAGIDAESLAYCADSIYQVSPNIVVTELPLDVISISENIEHNEVSSCAALLGAQFIDKRYIGLLRQYKVNRDRLNDRREMLERLKPAAILGSAALIVITVLWGYRTYLSYELNELIFYNTDPAVIQAVADYDSLDSDNLNIEQQLTELRDDADALNSYPLPDSKVINKLLSFSTGDIQIEVDGYNASTGIISMKTSSSNVDAIYSFIDKLREQDIFCDVDYTGYSSGNYGEDWTVSVVCTLSEFAGR